MRDAGILGGDILVVDRSLDPADKQIVVAMLDGDFTVKRLRRDGDRVVLESGNDSFPPIQYHRRPGGRLLGPRERSCEAGGGLQARREPQRHLKASLNRFELLLKTGRPRK